MSVRTRAALPPLLAAAALATAAGLAIAPVTAQAPPPAGVTALGTAGLLLFAAALAIPWPPALPWALGLLGAEYLLSLGLRGPRLDLAAPAYAAGFFLCAELGWLGLEARGGGRPWPGRVLAIGVVATGGAALGTALLLVAVLPLPGGPLLTGAGAAAAVGMAAVLAWLARR